MFERFTNRARTAVRVAQRDARAGVVARSVRTTCSSACLPIATVWRRECSGGWASTGRRW